MHAHKGEKHYTVSVFILTEQQPRKVLLLHHKKLDKWLVPGGHQESDENCYQAAIREVREETGIDITEYLDKPEKLDERAYRIPAPAFILDVTLTASEKYPQHHHLDMCYVVKLPHQEAELNEEESHDIKWFSKEEVRRVDTFDNLRDDLLRILSE